MRADLHIHTTASDGTWDPGQVVKAVCAAGIEFFAITDHDSVANVADTKKLAEKAGLRFLPGVELNSTKDGHNYHILGYGIDIENKKLLELCRHKGTSTRETIGILKASQKRTKRAPLRLAFTSSTPA